MEWCRRVGQVCIDSVISYQVWKFSKHTITHWFCWGEAVIHKEHKKSKATQEVRNGVQRGWFTPKNRILKHKCVTSFMIIFSLIMSILPKGWKLNIRKKTIEFFEIVIYAFIQPIKYCDRWSNLAIIFDTILFFFT